MIYSDGELARIIGAEQVFLFLKGKTVERKASRSQERPHKTKWFPQESGTAEVKFIWNASAYVLNWKTLCRRKTRKQALPRSLGNVWECVCSRRIQSHELPALLLCCITFPQAERVVPDGWTDNLK